MGGGGNGRAVKLEVGGGKAVIDHYQRNFFVTSLRQYQAGKFILLKQCYYCANMAYFAPPPSPPILLGLNKITLAYFSFLQIKKK